ncbi:ABC transporter ATP-binding protein [Sphingomonas alpina]|uniref:ATP-binding cassette domain-containing protein n=1 Tax=Sphingomonas alpina TaxID=653931 RepID=A0A7H0LNA0_9SPHN|nr:ATP-binding cassette domain-containing protein [Sphingomonas alpina]QNQ11153.1 ATP-binding cassette domain-containing protein [Sphingomonas alpina]
MSAPYLRVIDPGHTPRAGASVAVRGLTVEFGANRVLDRLDLDLAAGEFVSIVGRSGCGKSTLLRAVLGLLTPSEGRVETDIAASRVVFQEPRLLPWATVRDNVAVGARGIVDRATRDRLIDERLDEVGLADKAGEWPANLSGGQRQRVALARALISRPRLLVLDEPLGALDALTRIEMQGLLERVWAAESFSALLVTHDVAEAVALGDRVIVLEAGRIALDIRVDIPRPRRHGDAELARIEGVILDRLLRR